MDTTSPAFDAAADSGLTGDDDRVRAEGLVDPAAARRLLARRATLRVILARYVDGDPGSLRILTAPGGKPVLIPGPAFSVAHSGDLFAVAVGATSSVGVDVERFRPVSRAAAIADRWFGPTEAGSLAQVAEDERDAAFLRLWTAKEALAKRHGAGLRLMKGGGGGPTDALNVELGVAEGYLTWFDPGDGYLGALASTDPIEEALIQRPGDELWKTP